MQSNLFCFINSLGVFTFSKIIFFVNIWVFSSVSLHLSPQKSYYCTWICTSFFPLVISHSLTRVTQIWQGSRIVGENNSYKSCQNKCPGRHLFSSPLKKRLTWRESTQKGTLYKLPLWENFNHIFHQRLHLLKCQLHQSLAWIHKNECLYFLCTRTTGILFFFFFFPPVCN